VPVDADIAREDEVPYRSIDVNEVLDKMDSARTPINLVLLDACRNNPFARSFKLSQVGLAQMDAPSGTLIGFATSPGSVAQDGEGDNGLYTSALLRHMSEAGLPIEQMLKRVRVDVARASNNSQVPWEASSLNRDFFFKPLAGASAKPAAPAADELSMELAFWDAVKSSSSPADYLAYLEQYPKGRFAALARVRAGRPAAEGRVLPEPVSPAAVAAAPPSPSMAAPISAPLTAPVTASMASPTALTTALAAAGKPVRAESPEGLYSAIADANSLRFVDASRRTVSELSLDDSKRLVVHALAFSADGRWLAVSGSREGRGVQMLVSVSEGRVAWERAGVALSFDTTQPLAQLQLASGELELVGLGETAALRAGGRP
jgi:hypothetical protein